MDAGTAISIFLGAALAVFSVCLVGYSLFRGRSSGPADQKGASGESATPEGDDPALGDIFDAIRTLELEYQLGRLSQEEFQTQFQAYRVQAANVLREQLEAGRGDPAWVLEQEIRSAEPDLPHSARRARFLRNDSQNQMIRKTTDRSKAWS